jgi:cytidine deaminase
MPNAGLSNDTINQLLSTAKHAAETAYAPYSQFRVGAALLGQSGTVYSGVNIENQSYGLTVCAERSAIFQAVSQGEKTFQAIAVWGLDTPTGYITPCGACRQVLAEFFTPETPIFTAGKDGTTFAQLTLSELLPHAFTL